MTIMKLNFTQSLFESVSGWTTTGLTVIDESKAPHLILLWRSLMQLAGGAGLAIIMLAAIAGPMGPGLSVAEGRREQLVPHVRESARKVTGIYLGYVIAGIIAYWLAGMGLFDAVNHTFTSVSTGGFSTHPGSIGYWDSIAVEAISIPLMILGSLNFLTAYMLFQRKIKAVFRNGEVRLAIILIPICSLILFMLVSRTIYSTLGKGIRVSIYESVSALTTTGFTTTTYLNWAPIGFFIIISLMVIGGSTGSTAGGIKLYRIYLIFKSILWEMRRPFLPRTAVVENYVWMGERKISINQEHVRKVGTFAFLYLITYLIGSGILTGYGYGLKESLFEFASAIGTVGLSVGITSAKAPGGVLWTEIMGMFLGRLEFFVIIIGLGKVIGDSYTFFKYK
jgi:trk system potassium uptake protein TrkH